MKPKLNIVEVDKQIQTVNARYAKGYEGTLDFNFGYITALKAHKLISARDYENLLLVHASPKNEDCRYSISKSGKLIDYES